MGKTGRYFFKNGWQEEFVSRDLHTTERVKIEKGFLDPGSHVLVVAAGSTTSGRAENTC